MATNCLLNIEANFLDDQLRTSRSVIPDKKVLGVVGGLCRFLRESEDPGRIPGLFLGVGLEGEILEGFVIVVCMLELLEAGVSLKLIQGEWTAISLGGGRICASLISGQISITDKATPTS